jgi:hypothetical protein
VVGDRERERGYRWEEVVDCAMARPSPRNISVAGDKVVGEETMGESPLENRDIMDMDAVASMWE